MPLIRALMPCRSRTRIAAMILLAASLSGAASAQMYKEETGPGLDPTPIVIPSSRPTAARAITTRDLLSIRDLYGVSISPDGKQIAFIVGQAVAETNRYRNALMVVGTSPGGALKNLGNVGPPFWKLGGQWFPEPPRWSPAGRFLAARMKGGDRWQVWRWTVAGGSPVQLTRSPRDVQAFRWSEDGARIIYEVYPARDDAGIERLRDGGVLFDQDFQAPWDIHSGVIEQKLALAPDRTETWLHEMSGGEDRAATPEESRRLAGWVRGWEDENTVDAVWSPDHGRLAYNKYLDDPAKCRLSCYPLFVRDADGRNEKLLTPGVYYAGNPQWSADGKKIYYEARDGDGRGATLMKVSPEGGAVSIVLRSDDHLSDCTWDARKEHVACVAENNVTPPRVAFGDIATGKLSIVADVNPEFAALRVTSGKRIDWKNDNNMFAYLVKPSGYESGKRYPLIVTTYRSGTGFLRGGVGDEYPIHVFAAQGFAVLVFDCGADENITPGDFEKAMRIWEAPLEGLQAAIGAVVQEGIADPARIGFTGLSHGSEIGAYTMSHSDIFRAVSMSGAGSWDPGLTDMVPGWLRHYLGRWGVVDASGRPVKERFDRLSATAHADSVRAPLLLNVPDREYLTSLPMYAALKSREKPVEMWVYTDEYHEKIQPKHRLSVYDRNVDWFRFWLKGEEDPSPAKKEQYERWRKLRELDAKNKESRR